MKTCPFCGTAWIYASVGDYGSGYEENGYKIGCRCGFAWKVIKWCDSKEEAIKEWNTEVEKGEPMEIYSGHEGKDRVCCNCRHDKRILEGTYIKRKCDIDGHYIEYVQCFDNWCRRWAKEEESEE